MAETILWLYSFSLLFCVIYPQDLDSTSVVLPTPGLVPICDDEEIRLVGGSDDVEGRVEVCWDGEWGTICDDFWDDKDAEVVCKQLDLEYTRAIAYGSAYFGAGEGEIVLDNVQCVGTEQSIFNCTYNPVHDCVHNEDAGVRCRTASCSNNDVRLVNGFSDYEGRVEVCLNGKWGTVCDDFWSTNDAKVVCKQLNISVEDAIAIGSAYFGLGSGPINMDDVVCSGSEDQLSSCQFSTDHNCDHSEDASVICMDTQSNCTDGEIRLVGGSNETEGRVEVCIDNEWGTVCDDLWGLGDARVVCRQLGFDAQSTVAVRNAGFGQGIGEIFLDNVQCNGDESDLLACSYSPIHNCVHAEDAGVECNGPGSECAHGDIKLVGGSNYTEGRVEVCIDGFWGTVCDDLWGQPDAEVVCRQLGYPYSGAVAHSFAEYGAGSGRINMDNVQCTGDEDALVNCTYNPDHNCGHFEDAGVECRQGECEGGMVRLVGGTNETEGRVEVCIGGSWGTVCDTFWTAVDARVVCRQLGYPWEGSIAYNSAYFGQGFIDIVINHVQCDGTESELVDCTYSTFTFFCQHNDDAGVACLPSANNCTDGDVRLVSGSGDYEGRVEVCSFGQWGTVCDNSWGVTDAQVVCKQLNYEYTGALPYSSAYFGPGSGEIILNNVGCTGNEDSIFNCSYTSVHTCVHNEDAGVVCATASCNNSDVRLVNGFSDYEGRVEVCLNGIWGTVCDNVWSTNDATVVCRQLNISYENAVAIGSAYFGLGSGPINMDFVFCSGSENQLSSCPFSIDHNCGHSEDASVICVDTQSNCTDGEIRLIGGSNETEGRVEVCLDNEWGTVCDDLWGTNDARVVCRQLGFGTQGVVAIRNAGFGQGRGEIYLDNVQCNGGESDLLACSYSPIHNCVHREDAGIECNGPGSECAHGDIKLVGGSNYTEGRVEVCIDGFWGTVCDDLWGQPDAEVVCKQLGYPYSGAVAHSFAEYGAGSGRINMDNVQCTGDEDALVNCTYNPDHNCGHFEDAGVECRQGECEGGMVRLVGGTNETEGRVEVCIGGSWGTVCDTFWTAVDARVVCKQLGYPWEGSKAYNSAYFGEGHVDIVMNSVQCDGTESELVDCTYSTFTFFCQHEDDAGVACLPNPNDCSDREVRLVGGSDNHEGRVEVCSFGQWGTVCDNSWGVIDAKVVCKQLNYEFTGAIAYSSAYFGFGIGEIILNNVGCTGNEDSIFNCSYTSVHTCVHNEDAGVVCATASCNNSDVRLVNGFSDYEGRVEVCLNGVWGTVCDNFWSTNDATVVCRQLNISYENAVSLQNAYFGLGSGAINMNNVFCDGTENKLVDCAYNSQHNCQHFKDASVICIDTQSNCTDGEVRLIGGSNSTEGRVEVCFSNSWRTVCDDLWGENDARVVCRQLGFEPEGSVAFTHAYFGSGTGSILFDNVQCTGDEVDLFACSYSAIHDCGHNEDAGVRCIKREMLVSTTLIDISSSKMSTSQFVSLMPHSVSTPGLTSPSFEVLSSIVSSFLSTALISSSSMMQSSSLSSMISSVAESSSTFRSLSSVVTATSKSSTNTMISTSTAKSTLTSFSSSSPISSPNVGYTSSSTPMVISATSSSTSSSFITLTSSLSSMTSSIVESSPISTAQSQSGVVTSTSAYSTITVQSTPTATSISTSFNSSAHRSSQKHGSTFSTPTVISSTTSSSSIIITSSLPSTTSSIVESSTIFTAQSQSGVVTSTSASSIIMLLSTSTAIFSTTFSSSAQRSSPNRGSTSSFTPMVITLTSSSTGSSSIIITPFSSSSVSKSSATLDFTATSSKLMVTSSVAYTSTSVSISSVTTTPYTSSTTFRLSTRPSSISSVLLTSISRQTSSSFSTFSRSQSQQSCLSTVSFSDTFIIADNTVVATIGGYTLDTFNSSKQSLFQTITRESLQTYCLTHTEECKFEASSSDICVVLSRRRQASSSIQLSFYATFDANIIPGDATFSAIKMAQDNGSYREAGFSSLEFTLPTVGSTRSQGLSEAAKVGIAITVIVVILASVILIAIAVCIIFRKQQNSSKYTIGDKLFGDNSMLDMPSSVNTCADVTSVIKTSDEDDMYDKIILIKEDLTEM